MNKFFSLVKKHLISSIAILVGAVAILLTGVMFLTSYVSYVKYSENYEDMKTKLLANTPQLPEEVFKDNEYVDYDDANGSVVSTKSSYANPYLLSVRDAEIELDEGQPTFSTFDGTSWEVANGFKKGGSITYTVNAATNGMSDIDVYLGLGEIKNVPIDNLIDFITIKVNGLSVTTVDFNLPSNGSLQQLVLKKTNLIKGENTLEFATSVSDGSNNFIMPAIAAVTFITDIELAQPLDQLNNRGVYALCALFILLITDFVVICFFLFAIWLNYSQNNNGIKYERSAYGK